MQSIEKTKIFLQMMQQMKSELWGQNSEHHYGRRRYWNVIHDNSNIDYMAICVIRTTCNWIWIVSISVQIFVKYRKIIENKSDICAPFPKGADWLIEGLQCRYG